MAKNHIIIGLGGRGGDTLKAFRRALFKNSMSTKKAESYPIQCIYVDSDQDDLDNGWNEGIGVDYSIPTWARVNTRKDIDWNEITKNMSRYPTISPWLGDLQDWAKLDVKTEKGSGQLRRLGRAYFAASITKQQDNSFNKALSAARTKVQNVSEDSSETHYHIVVGLSGGTGSGAIVDTIAQISLLIKKESRLNDKIYLYGVLPERDAPKGKDILGYYYPNAYAALKEINAIALYNDKDPGRPHYLPINVETYSSAGNNKIASKIDSCLLFSNENSESKVIDYKIALPNLVGDFLYHAIVSLPASGDEGVQAYAKLVENATIGTETDDFSGLKERALKFGSASLKRIEIPQIEVIDLLGAWVAQQFLFQQRHNNWSDTKGYINEKPQDITSEFVDVKNSPSNILELCNITLNHLSLKTPRKVSKDGNKVDNFKDADDDWKTVSEGLKKNSMEVYTAGTTKEPIVYFSQYMDSYFNTQFRGSGIGVDKFWSEKSADIEQVANTFYKDIENCLVELWVSKNNKVIGINEATKILDRVREQLQKISAHATKRIAHLTDPTKFDSTDADFTNSGCMKEIKGRIEEFGTFLKFRRNSTVIEEGMWFISKLYVNKTDVIAFKFAIQLIDKIQKKLDDLSTTIKNISLSIDKAEKVLQDAISEKEKVFKSVESDNKSYHAQNVKMLYASGEIERDFGIIINEKNIFLEKMKDFRSDINKSRINGDLNNESNYTFIDLYKNLSVDNLTKGYLFYLNEKIPDFYLQLEKAGKFTNDNKLVGRNVLNYFQKHPDFQQDSKLKEYFSNILKETGVSARLKDIEPTGNTIGVAFNNYGNETYIIHYPKYSDNNEAKAYEQKFVDIIKEVFPAKSEVLPYESDKKNEITIFKAKGVMALRSFEMVSTMIHEQYQRMTSESQFVSISNLVLHTEGTASNYPKIVPFEDPEKPTQWNIMFDSQILGYILLGKALDYIVTIKDKYHFDTVPENKTDSDVDLISEEKVRLYQIKDYLMNSKTSTFLQGVIIENGTEIPVRTYQKIIQTINLVIPTREKDLVAFKNGIISKIKQEVLPGILTTDYDGDVTDKEYQKIERSIQFIENEILTLKLN
jgi:hypothetical protein